MIFYIIPIILIIFIIVLLTICNKLCKIVIYPNRKSYDYTYEHQVKNKNLEPFFNKVNSIKEDICIKSTYGYDLKGYFIPNKSSDKVIIICHGITANTNSSIKYASLFYEHGFSIFLYDHRNHGYSGGDFTSMGYFEKYDLKSCADWIYNKLGNNITLGVFGESMGAGTAMQYCGIDNRVDFCIEDCGYSDVKDLLTTRLREDYNINCPPLVTLTSKVMGFKYNWTFEKTSPISYIKDLSIPMLFIHGDSDTYVPTKMLYELYNAKTKGIKEQYICKGATHANSYTTDPIKYKEIISSFLKEINLD